MRVLELTGEPIYHGGQEKFIANLIENIQDENLRIDVLTPYEIDNKSFCNLVKENGGEVHSFGYEFLPGKSRRFLIDCIETFLNNDADYDVVHIHSGSISVLAYGAVAAKKAGIKKIIVHSHATAAKSIKHTMVKAFLGGTIRKNATEFWACSLDAGADKYPKSIVESKLVVIPNGIKADDFKRDEEKRRIIRKELNISNECFVVGHVGRFSHEKNHNMLIKVFKKVKARNAASKLLLVGDGELIDDVRQAVSENNLINEVIFTGNVDNVADYYQAMDCFAFPSRFEGFGYVALEAQAAGLPCVISSEVPSDVVVGRNVKILPLSEEEDWVSCILECKNQSITDNNEAIENAGYDVKRTAEMIRRKYYKI